MSRLVRFASVGVVVTAGFIAWRAVSRAPNVPSGTTSDAFITEAREGTRRYASQQEAINDGFVRVGVEFPAMGEHWVSFARVMEDTFVASRPSLLIYANTSKGAQLAGVAYSRLLTGRGTVPEFPSQGAWHEHSGPVNEESLPIGHMGHATPRRTGAASTDAPQLFVLHAWVWQPNPDGPFATDNWSLPLVRLGLPSTESLSSDALRALTLASDEHGYYRLVIKTTLELSDAEDSVAALVLERHRALAARDLPAIRQVASITPARARALREAWDSMWPELERGLPAHRAALQRLRSQLTMTAP